MARNTEANRIMQQLIPKGFNLIAKTELTGFGDTIVRAYANSRREVYFSIEHSKGGEKRFSNFGPIDHRLLEPFQITLGDVIDMKGMMNFINES